MRCSSRILPSGAMQLHTYGMFEYQLNYAGSRVIWSKVRPNSFHVSGNVISINPTVIPNTAVNINQTSATNFEIMN